MCTLKERKRSQAERVSVICINFGDAQVFDSHHTSVRTREYIRTHTRVACESLASGHAWIDKLLVSGTVPVTLIRAEDMTRVCS